MLESDWLVTAGGHMSTLRKSILRLNSSRANTSLKKMSTIDLIFIKNDRLFCLSNSQKNEDGTTSDLGE